jgi:hypothetical protein
MQNIGGKKRTRQEEVDSDYRFGNFLQLSAFRSWDKASLPYSFRSPPKQVLSGHHFTGMEVALVTPRRKAFAFSLFEIGHLHTDRVSGPRW